MKNSVIVFADGHVGSELVSWLAEKHHDDIGVVFTIEKNEISETCVAKGISTAVFSSESDAISIIKSNKLTPRLGFLIWWPTIITSKLLAIASTGFINTHPSLLPSARGKHYNFWTLVEGAPFGVSMHFVDEGIDSGDVVVQNEVQYGWEDNGGSLFLKAKEAMIELFQDNFERIRDLNFRAKPQDLSKGSFHLGKELDAASQIRLDQEYTARDLLNLLRARTMEGYPGCYFLENEKKYEVTIKIKLVR